MVPARMQNIALGEDNEKLLADVSRVHCSTCDKHVC